MYRYSEKARTDNRSRQNASPSTLRRSPRPRRIPQWARRINEERGAIAAFVAVSLVGIIGAGGLAIDLGRGFVRQVRISRAVDAAVIASASAIRQGVAAAEAQGRAVASLNGITDGVDGVSFSLSFATSGDGERTVTGEAAQPMPTTLMRILGWEQVDIGAAAVAAVPPLDVSLVIDQSGSLAREGAWDDLQDAVVEFLANFEDTIDQFALSHFQMRAETAFSLDGFFTAPMSSEVRNMSSAGDTNTGEGLRLAHEALQTAAVRPRAKQVAIFFTDGRPTAARINLNGQDRVIAVSVYQTGRVRGYFNQPDNATRWPMNRQATPSGCRNVRSCYGWGENDVRNEARRQGLQRADEIRSDDILLYTIGLGTFGNNDPIVQPDLGYLRRLANEDGIENANQPKGRMYFAPTPDDLSDVFQQLAQDLLVRLAQ